MADEKINAERNVMLGLVAILLISQGLAYLAAVYDSGEDIGRAQVQMSENPATRNTIR